MTNVYTKLARVSHQSAHGYHLRIEILVKPRSHNTAWAAQPTNLYAITAPSLLTAVAKSVILCPVYAHNSLYLPLKH